MDCSPPSSSVHGDSPSKNWNGLPFPSPGDLPDPWIEPGLLHCRQILYRLSHQGSLRGHQFISVQLLSRVQLFATPWTVRGHSANIAWQAGPHPQSCCLEGRQTGNLRVLTIRVHSARNAGEYFRSWYERHQSQSWDSQSPAASLLLPGMLSPGWKICNPLHVTGLTLSTS